MKNLKRTLSLALASVMLLGMMVVGSSAAFIDADEIVNKEAVEITAGLGLFAGNPDGSFNPKGTVTRAQMATVIVKMLYGSDINADQFKGIGKFSDTAAFEGGWAEGYINLCADQGVVSGYGDGTYKPGNSVTTAEAVTMILNALDVDAGEGTWPLTFMAKAEEMKLFSELAVKPLTHDPLTRDQLAVLVLAGLEYSPSGVTGYRVSGMDIVFNSFSDALVACRDTTQITPVVGEDALINSVFDMKISRGFITSNQSAGENVTVLTLNNGDEENFDVVTSKEMLGHYVSVYYKEHYKNEKNPGKVYAVIDESETITVTETISSSKSYKEVFGRGYDIAANGVVFDGTYVPTEKLSGDMTSAVSGYTKGSAAPKGTYIIVDGEIVSYIAENISYASYIVNINATEGQESVLVNGANGNLAIPNAEDDDRIVEYEGMSVGDFVSYAEIQGVFTLTKLQSVSGVVSKSSKTKIDGIAYGTLSVNDNAYVAAAPGHSYIGKKLETDLSNIQFGQEYTLYINENNRFVGFESSSGAADLNKVVYMLGVIPVSTQDQYGQNIISYRGRGVDMDGNEVMLLLGKVSDSDDNGVLNGDENWWGDVSGSLAEGFYTVAESRDKDDKKAGIQILTPYTQTCTAAGDTFVTTSNGAVSYSGSNGMVTTDGKYTYSSETSKFIIIDGDVNTARPLDVTVKLKSIPSRKLENKHPVLVTRAANGTQNIQEVMIIKGTVLDVLGNDGIYVAYITQEQLGSVSVTAEGTVYEVYNASTTELTELVVDAPITTAGFYEVVPDADGNNTVTLIQDAGDETASLLYANLSFGGMQTSTRMFASNSGKTLGSHTTKNLKVVDLRSDNEIAASGVPEISSLEQLNLLYNSNPGMVVIFDLYVKDASTDEANGMYITKAYHTSPGLGSIVYCHVAPEADGGEQVMTVVKSGSSIMGDPVHVVYDVCDAQGVGFYEFCVDEAGRLALNKVGFNDVTGSRGTMALHNTIVSFDGEILTTFSKADASCDDAANEAMPVVNITNSTRIFDATGREVGVEALTPGKIVNYYCSTPTHKDDAEVSDDTVEMIFVVENDCNCGA